ncbi:MAG: hypothetical protein CBC12_04880 [Candidatus Puniceispirillum sp. TMED52]|nr:MAG: hypothetical protein CBC12_04880 [Candidatus Puniceispirillum sp. TMED52]
MILDDSCDVQLGEAIHQAASRHDLELCTETSLLKSLSRAPTIVILFNPISPPSIRPNHIEYIHLRNPGDLSLVSTETLVSVAEQKILQRMSLKNHRLNSVFFERFNLVGESRVFTRAMNLIERAADTDSRVIIEGETGTGKESAAHALHVLSPRASGPFVPINCGALTDDLIQSELFGHVKGAFTGAVDNKPGLVELANGGTLFLDEIDSLSTRAQVSLLRFIQDGEYRPVGSRKTQTSDVRIIGATNKSLRTLVSRGKFREDLYYRVNVLNVKLPPIRNRGSDVFLLSQQILAKIAQVLDRTPKYLGTNLIEHLHKAELNGNYRELESCLLRCFLLSPSDVMDDPTLLNEEESDSSDSAEDRIRPFSLEKNAVVARFEREYIHRALTQTGGNVSKAAALARKERRTFTRLMEKHRFERLSFTRAKS